MPAAINVEEENEVPRQARLLHQQVKQWLHVQHPRRVQQSGALARNRQNSLYLQHIFEFWRVLASNPMLNMSVYEHSLNQCKIQVCVLCTCNRNTKIHVMTIEHNFGARRNPAFHCYRQHAVVLLSMIRWLPSKEVHRGKSKL